MGTVEGVGDLALQVILLKAGPKECAIVACVNKRFKLSASEDLIWSQFCAQDLSLSSPVDHLGYPLPSFKAAYQTWRNEFCMYPWSLVKRVKICWDRIKSWLNQNFPEAEASLRRGASEDDLRELETVLNVRLPRPTRILYRFCDGQEFQGKDFFSSPDSLQGLIGGYIFYDHLVNVYMLPLSQIIFQTKAVIRHLGFSSRPKYIVLAASCTFEKVFFLNCYSGQLHVGTRNLPTDGEMMQCVPEGLIRSVHDYDCDQQQDATLLWLEEHGRRLWDGLLKIREDELGKSISQFPEEAPLCTTAVTNGVKVRASAVFVPELSDLQDSSEKYLFAYSIRLSLLPEGCIINRMSFGSCQLERRHWIIRANDVVASDVNGEAVVGKYPILNPGEKEFVYESCTPLFTSQGSVEGSFTFVPGSLANPKGSRFEVEVARFPLRLPDYIF